MAKFEDWCDTCDADTEHELVEYDSRYGKSADLVCIICDTPNREDLEPEDLEDPDYARDMDMELY